MSFSTDWDINDYKTEYESEEHWELRKKFMETYKDKFPEDELVCLAQVFINVEFMGCRYPDETMRTVGELSQEVANDFRQERAGRLKRTFVKASDAAEQKAKGTRLKSTNESNTFQITAILKATKINENSDSEDDSRPSFLGAKKKVIDHAHLLNNYWSALIVNQNKDVNDGVDIFFNISDIEDYTEPVKSKVNLFTGLKFGKLILMITGDRSNLAISAKKCGFKLEEQENISERGEKTCEILLNSRQIGFGKGESIKIAKKFAYDTAMKFLQCECYSIKPRVDSEKINISRTNQTITANFAISSEGSKLDANNVGYKMMKKLGWSGGALGVRTKGREEPIDCLTVKNNRKGLGNSSDDINKNYFGKLLKSYVNSDDIRDLYFDSGFSKEERAQLHQVALSKCLKSASYGKGDNRYLVISKRTVSAENILTEVLLNKNPMYVNKYEVKVPKCKRTNFPDNAEFKSDKNEK